MAPKFDPLTPMKAQAASKRLRGRKATGLAHSPPPESDGIRRTSPGWLIVCDEQLTRRKFFHCVVNPADECVFISRHLWECIEWLVAEDVEVYQLIPPSTKKVNFATPVTCTRKP